MVESFNFAKIFFYRKYSILEIIYFVLEEINSVDNKIVLLIPGGNSFGRKIWFCKEFFLFRNMFSVDKKLMCSDPERISVDQFGILEWIYFLLEELISVRNQYAQILKRFMLTFFVFCSWKDLFLSNMNDFLIPIQNATKARDFLPIFWFNF